MAYVELVRDEDLPASIAAETEGHTPNFVRLLAHRPAVLDAWKQLLGAVKANMDERRYELATLAAARRLRSSYCCLAHGKVLAEKFYSPAEVAAIADGRHALDETDRAVMDLAEKVVVDATSIDDRDRQPLRDLGLSEDEIMDVVLAAAARCFFAKTLDALGVLPDASLSELDAGVREVFVVGRPIATD
jgi:uncharacterized peroxidase-related enzyme